MLEWYDDKLEIMPVLSGRNSWELSGARGRRRKYREFAGVRITGTWMTRSRRGSPTTSLSARAAAASSSAAAAASSSSSASARVRFLWHRFTTILYLASLISLKEKAILNCSNII